MMENQRNTILAIVLSLAVLLLWNIFYLEPQMDAQRRAAQEAVAEATENGTLPVEAGRTLDPEAALPGATLPAAARTADAGAPTDETGAGQAAGRVPIATDAVEGSINLRGARLDDLILRRYRETVDEASPPVRLLAPAEEPNGYFVELGFAGADAAPKDDTVWTADPGATLTTQTPVTLTWDNGEGLRFVREIAIDESYLFTVTDRVENAGTAAVALQPYGRSTRFYAAEGPQIFVLHEGLLGWLGEEGLAEIDYSEVEDDGTLAYGRTTEGWLGITDKYWATALIPELAANARPAAAEQGAIPGGAGAAAGGFTPRFTYRDAGRPRWQADYLRDPVSIAPGETTTVVNRVYAGAKKTAIIDEIGDRYGIANFDLMIDWGWFYFITRPVFSLIQFFQGLIGNFGVAILLTTVVIKAIFFPLANKSYASMAMMKKLQPKMQEIKEKHGEDRQAQQRAMMELYKTEKINPVAGCWPVLLQIPVFFALYKVIYVTIEMRHAPFFGWIQDLSAPDPSSIWNLFGLIPWEPALYLPAFLLLGAWPLMMGITMFLQMRLNPVPPDPTQAMIFTWMPVVFTFMLSTFPAGLVIYWAWNNFLSIIQQATIMKRHGTKIELWDNLKGLFTRKKAADPAE